MKIRLEQGWQMRKVGGEYMPITIPGSVYSNLLTLGLMEDPFYRENEHEALNLSRDDYEFKTEFILSNDLLQAKRLYLQFDMIDTLADIYLNGKKVGYVNNMHRVWRFEIKDYILDGTNELVIHFYSPVQYIEAKQKERELWGVAVAMDGFPHIRKAHYMFGWDWGPMLPDMGIYREVSIEGVDIARIDEVQFKQIHTEHEVELVTKISVETMAQESSMIEVLIKSPTGEEICLLHPTQSEVELSSLITSPHIWWPNGFGEHLLYDIIVTLFINKEGRKVLDTKSYKIGLRTMEISRDNDEYGQEFCFKVNGAKIFAMGADYIPEDNIIARTSRNKTEKLLKQCVEANFNCIRVWGGGYYPDDYFYDLCDELGLIVWQDFMYACGVYWLTEDFKENMIAEAVDNVKRLRHHASLGIWCGNNEMEMAWDWWGIPQIADLRQDYLTQFEELLPAVCEAHDEATSYWPCSPSSGGGFNEANSSDCGDTHYWDVWHGMVPIEDFKKHYFRFCSEYGFVSLPSIKTIESFTEVEDRNIFSPVMELHHRCEDGNKKLMYYISQRMRYPNSMEQLVYATQMIQADAIRENVEHMRRHRGRCMGSVYWQLNDTNPAVSWSSIDYFGRWKALHYYTKKFYAPILLSMDADDVANIRFNISNETMKSVAGQLIYRLYDNRVGVIKEETVFLDVEALSARDICYADFSKYLLNKLEKRHYYMQYELWVDGVKIADETSLFVTCKEFEFKKPNLDYTMIEKSNVYEISLSTNTYTKGVYLELKQDDLVFSDNWFDICGGQSVTITLDKSQLQDDLSVEKLTEQLSMMTVYDVGR